VILKETPSGGRSSLTSGSASEMFLEDLPMRQRSVKSPGLRLTFSSSSELEELLLEKSKPLRTAHLLELLLFLVLEVVLHLIVALAIVVPLGVVILVGADLLLLGAVGDEVTGVAALEAAP
jgi:nitrate reductase NapE component